MCLRPDDFLGEMGDHRAEITVACADAHRLMPALSRQLVLPRSCRNFSETVMQLARGENCYLVKPCGAG